MSIWIWTALNCQGLIILYKAKWLMLWQQFAFIWALPFLEWIGVVMGRPIYISQVQIITLGQFIPGCVIFDEVLKSNSSDNTNLWNVQDLADFFFFTGHITDCLFFLLVELIAVDKCCIWYHVPTVKHDTASIIQECVLSRGTHTRFCWSIFSLSPPSHCPALCFHLPYLMLLSVFISD